MGRDRMEEGKVLRTNRSCRLQMHLKEDKCGLQKMGWLGDLAGDKGRPIGS